MSPPNGNSFTTKELNKSEVDEISNNELKKTMTRMMNEIKEEMYQHLNEIKKM
jgi:hypothetical protein